MLPAPVHQQRRFTYPDDTAYVWQAQQIAHHPLDPYGFSSNWDATQHPFWQNRPRILPLIAYYGALVGCVAGWSEEAPYTWHFYCLRWSSRWGHIVTLRGDSQNIRWWLRAAAFLCPGVIVSSTTIMTVSPKHGRHLGAGGDFLD